MPTKTTNAGRQYRIDGRRFVWTPEVLADEDPLPDISIPLRIKLGVVRDLAGRDLDAAAMFDVLGRLIPGQAAVLDDMDLNDFQDMFSTWQAEYEALSGASLGESSAQPARSPSIGDQPNTTGVPASA